MAENIIFAYDCTEDFAQKFRLSLESCGLDIESMNLKYLKKSVIDELKNSTNCVYTAVIIKYELESKSPLNVADCDAMVTTNENIVIIPILPNDFLGSDFVKRLLDVGIFSALFEKEADGQNIARLIKQKGRNRKSAKEYYGIMDYNGESEEKEVFTPDKYINLIVTQDNDNNINKRIEAVKESVSQEQFAVIMKSLPDDIKDAIVKDGIYDMYFPEKSVKKMDTNTINEGESRRIIGVVTLSERAGGTFVSLNLSKRLSESVGAGKVSLLQLPYNSDLYSRLSLQNYFGTSFDSYVSAIYNNRSLSAIKNIYKGIRLFLPNPYTDNLDDWTMKHTLKLLLALQGVAIIDLGKFEVGLLSDISVALTDIVIVVQAEEKERMFDFIENIRKSNSEIKISIIIDKCKAESVNYSEWYDLAKDIQGCLTISTIDRKVFDAAGDDILYPNHYTGSLASLAALIDGLYNPLERIENNEKSGFNIRKLIKGGKKHKHERKTGIRKNAAVNIGMAIDIGVGGVCSGVGSTHTALMIAAALSEDYAVAVVEQNNKGAFANIYAQYVFKAPIDKNKVPPFEFKGIDLYPYCNYTQFSALYKHKYDFIIVDFGTEFICSTFFSMNKNIVVGTCCDWKLLDFIDFTENVENYKPVQSLHYLVPFVKDRQIKELKKKCTLRRNDKIYPIPFCSEWDKVSSEAVVVFDDIINTSK